MYILSKDYQSTIAKLGHEYFMETIGSVGPFPFRAMNLRVVEC